MVRRQSIKPSAVWPVQSRSPRPTEPVPIKAAERPRSGPPPRHDELPIPLWTIDRAGRLSGVNPAFVEWTGCHAGPDTALGGLQLVHPDDRALARATFLSSLATGADFRMPLRIRHHAGDYRWLDLHARRRTATDGQPERWAGAAFDIDAQVRREQGLQEDVDTRTRMLDGSVDCIKILRPDGHLRRMNRAGCLALGAPLDDGHIGLKWQELLPAEIRPLASRALQRARQGQPARFAGKSVTADGRVQYWDNMLTPIQGDQGEVESILCISREVTAQREAERLLRLASDVDPLTALANRRAFERKSHRLIRQARQAQGQLGLLLIDLDHFKHINDTLGHSAGDHLLRSLARRLARHLEGEHITVARLGGDEFAILIDRLEDARQLLDIAGQAVAQLDAPVRFEGHVINGGMSIGAAVYPQDGRSLSQLMARADTALNDLKAGGRGGVRLFTPAMLEHAEILAEQFDRARMIIRRQLAEPHYQPKVDLADGRIIGMEALLRWRDADGQLQFPAKVSEAFNDYELASGIGEMMQNKVFADLAAWHAQGLPLVPVSINVTPVEFLRGQFARQLLARMQRHGIAPQWIEIEVTEQMLSSRHADFIASDLRLLKAQGITITLDDFGTGHSSFTHLRDYPIDTLKIDSSFVRRIDVDASSLAVVKAVIALGALFQVKVIAEGVETEVQRQLLQDAGCRWGQGFLFARALDARAIRELLPH